MLELLLYYYYYYRLSQLTTDNETYTTTKLTQETHRKDIEHIVAYPNCVVVIFGEFSSAAVPVIASLRASNELRV